MEPYATSAPARHAPTALERDNWLQRREQQYSMLKTYGAHSSHGGLFFEKKERAAALVDPARERDLQRSPSTLYSSLNFEVERSSAAAARATDSPAAARVDHPRTFSDADSVVDGSGDTSGKDSASIVSADGYADAAAAADAEAAVLAAANARRAARAARPAGNFAGKIPAPSDDDGDKSPISCVAKRNKFTA
ncbi:hypothetical protein M885DRAFT_506231 [Pelagophyceae sp. CCMP2097]|nr:hypothetical protein M885DRAFT_506231 [Pelagophyceae sp. CCMP2097]